jgi:hypothetical protein
VVRRLVDRGHFVDLLAAAAGIKVTSDRMTVRTTVG